MSVQECSAFLSCSDTVIYTAIREGRLQSYRLTSQTTKIRRSDFLKWIEGSKTDQS
jgi:excisionase family DNA binding protein